MGAKDFVKFRAPKFHDYCGVDNYIAIADAQTGAFDDKVMIGTLGTQRDLAIALRALHLMQRNEMRDKAGTPGGAIQSETEGSLSHSFKISDKDIKQFGDLTTTTWGCELIEMIRSNFILPINRMMGNIINPSNYAA
jgi:hypothetical protein